MNQSSFIYNLNLSDKQLQSFALRLTKYKDQSEDLYQETLLKAYNKRHLYQTNTNFKAWIFTIMYHTFINQYRQTRRRNIIDAPIDDLHATMDKHSYEISADKQMDYHAINNLVGCLDVNYKKPLILFAKGYKYKEISKQLDIPIGTVKSRINFARKKLKEQLTNLFGIQYNY